MHATIEKLLWYAVGGASYKAPLALRFEPFFPYVPPPFLAPPPFFAPPFFAAPAFFVAITLSRSFLSLLLPQDTVLKFAL